jgi:hypothetical protein
LQKLNVALIYGDNNDVHVIKDVILSDKDELNMVSVDFAGPVKAILPNWDDHAFLLQEYD